MGKRILVTGGAGFIGSHIVDALLGRGDAPQVLDDLSKGQVTNIADGVPLHVMDIASSRLQPLFTSQRFDAVVHCAAQTNVMRSLADAALDRSINVDGLARVLEAAVTTEVRRFVFISSGGAAYGETPVPATEETPPAPDNPYGRHKVEGEALVAAARISSMTLRLSNVYGPRQRSDSEGGVISIFADRLVAGRPLEVYGDGLQERDFIHVHDVVSAGALALDEPSLSGIWNVGTGTPTSVRDVVRVMRERFGASVPVAHLPARREIRRSCLDVRKLRSTGWQPRWALEMGIDDLARSMAPARFA
ncbi:MAG: NAD-dependent epimerase/dehydratase family protein [Chloroflexi bacterium]|nr:NAD-dependent epimerase/dehydratase family protein [Chloroflexota bacterium]